MEARSSPACFRFGQPCNCSNRQEAKTETEYYAKDDDEVRHGRAPCNHAIESRHQAHADAEEKTAEGIGNDVPRSGVPHPFPLIIRSDTDGPGPLRDTEYKEHDQSSDDQDQRQPPEWVVTRGVHHSHRYSSRANHSAIASHGEADLVPAGKSDRLDGARCERVGE